MVLQCCLCSFKWILWKKIFIFAYKCVNTMLCECATCVCLVISFLTREKAIILIFLLCVFDFIAGRIMNAIFIEDKYYAWMADITVKMYIFHLILSHTQWLRSIKNVTVLYPQLFYRTVVKTSYSQVTRIGDELSYR